MSSSRTDGRASVEVTMPQMGVSVSEGTVAQWRKRVGDWVEADETILEISTDKIDTEVPAPATGRVRRILAEEGATVAVGTPLAVIETDARPGEPHRDEQDPVGGAGIHSGRPVVEPAAGEAGPVVRRLAPTGAEAPHSAPVSPVVRRIAAEHGLDVGTLRGSGRGGRVTKKDVLAHIERSAGGDRAPVPEPVLHMESPYREETQPERSAGMGEARPLSAMRRQIGEHMVRSLHTAAHCTTVVEADMSRVEALRGRLSYLPFVARAVVMALRDHPSLNATLEGDRLTVHDDVHLGIAVSLGDDGLIVPVVRNAHELSAEGLAARIADLAARARSRRLSPDEVRGGTFTITNPGREGALLATPIINQPQVAILDLEAVVRRPVVVGGDSIAIRPMAYLCMSWDHRALDGVLAARFLSSVRRHVESLEG